MISLHPIVDLTENHFHEDRLRADPAAEQSTKDRGEKKDEDDRRDHRQSEQEEIVRTERKAEEDKFPVDNIEQHVRMSVNLDERSAEQYREQYRR